MTQYEGIVEVQALSPWRVNKWLAGGYQLLAIEVVATSGKHPIEPSGPNMGAYFVRRALRYVVGRTADVPEIPWQIADKDLKEQVLPQDLDLKTRVIDKAET